MELINSRLTTSALRTAYPPLRVLAPWARPSFQGLLGVVWFHEIGEEFDRGRCIPIRTAFIPPSHCDGVLLTTGLLTMRSAANDPA